MSATLWSLAAAGMYGTSDFLGGLAARRAPILRVLFFTQTFAFLALLPLALWLPSHPLPGDLWLAVGAGLAGVAATGVLYAALSLGSMSIVAPLSAAAAAAGSVAAGMVFGEHPLPVQWIGAVVCIAAILMMWHTRLPKAPETRRAIALALVAGAFISIFLVAISAVGPDSGLVPLLVARAVTLSIVVAALAARGTRPNVPRSTLTLAALCGAFDVFANASFVQATRLGLLSMAAVLSSLYPVATILLARVSLGERIEGRARLALPLALAGIVLTAW